jgi:hypothetical protein
VEQGLTTQLIGRDVEIHPQQRKAYRATGSANPPRLSSTRRRVERDARLGGVVVKYQEKLSAVRCQPHMLVGEREGRSGNVPQADSSFMRPCA